MNADTDPPVIRAEGLTKSYGAFRALLGVDLDVRRGEIFGFLGPNGAGKTTAIRCLLDLIRPDGGTLRVLGIDPQQSPVEVRRRCGYLPGELRLDENMRVDAALGFFQELRGGGNEMMRRADELAERLALRTDAKIKNLSKGNKQKLGIVAAFMHAPELLLLDEPTSGLDPLMQHTVLDLVREARDAGATIFFSSHVLAEVQHVAERVAIIRDGEIAATGRTDELTASKKVSVRVGMGPVNVAGRWLGEIDGVKQTRTWSEGTGAAAELEVDLSVDGSMDGLIKRLASHRVRWLETHQASLEDVFAEHYKSEGGEGAK